MYSAEVFAEYLAFMLIGAALLVLLLPLVTFVLSLFSQSARQAYLRGPSVLQRLYHSIRRKRDREIRREKRHTTRELRAEISDGHSNYCGLVANVSRLGICIRDIPQKLPSQRSLLSISIRNRHGQYRLVARPRWESLQSNNSKTIGAEIASAPEGWYDFIALRS